MKDPLQARIEREFHDHDVVLFMKGTPVFPQCGFSAVLVQVLSHLGVKFKGIDVLNDPALRQGIKAFSDETGELAQFLAARGVKTDIVRT